MKIHEYQAKEILAKYGVAVPRGEVANTPEEATAVTNKIFTDVATSIIIKTII
jgi:succinyl-CoA synthetase beta subunit